MSFLSKIRPFPGRVAILFVLLWLLITLPAGAIERRKDQYPTDFAYLIVPAPYSLPGIGQGIFLLGYASNVYETTADFYGYRLFGDVTGFGLGVQELPLWRDRMLVTAGSERIGAGTVNLYQTRGMNTHKNDYVLGEFRNYNNDYLEASLVLQERQLELKFLQNFNAFEIHGLRDSDGNLLVSFDPPAKEDYLSRLMALQWDNTDDYYDPRRGWRANLSRNFPTEPNDPAQPHYYVANLMVNGYLPVGEVSTLAISYFRSRAFVLRRGETDYNTIASGYCPGLDPACVGPSTGLINADLARNRYGTAQGLGGSQRLRGYPMDRFQGAQSEYLGTEFRWNFSDAVSAFDWLFWRDTRTSMQLAFIWEIGSVAETQDGLWERSRSDAGVGFRMITASGAVYRADFVAGDEGMQQTVIVFYPW